MTGHPNAPAHPPGTPATQATGLAGQLRAATDEQLAAILAAADEADIAAHQPGGLADSGTVARAALGTVEIMLLGALGCRYGMLAGGAGGYLLRTPAATVLVDPGPAAPGMLAELNGQVFSWAELDAIICTHFHPDHYAGIIPCLEGMASHAAPGQRKLLIANPTTTARLAAFSPYHAGGMADVLTLAHHTTEGDGEPSVKIGDLTIHAVPAAHTEHAGRHHSAIGLGFDTPPAASGTPPTPPSPTVSLRPSPPPCPKSAWSSRTLMPPTSTATPAAPRYATCRPATFSPSPPPSGPGTCSSSTTTPPTQPRTTG